MILCDLRPLRSAMKPTPQESIEGRIIETLRERRAGIGGVAEGRTLIGAGLLRKTCVRYFFCLSVSPAFLSCLAGATCRRRTRVRPQRRKAAAADSSF